MKFEDLIGKTISEVEKMSPKDFEDEYPYLRLGFTDGTHCFIEAGFGSWRDHILSQYEYPRYIEIRDDIDK